MVSLISKTRLAYWGSIYYGKKAMKPDDDFVDFAVDLLNGHEFSRHY
jgi:hypothetical protein